MAKNNVTIAGMGYYLPERVLTNYDLEKMVDTSNEWIVERTGIRERRIASECEFSSDMAARAAEMALENAKMRPEEIELIIAATITPDMTVPSLSCMVQDRIGAKNAAAFDINAACTGFIYALSSARGLMQSSGFKNALVIGVDTLSKITDWSDRNTCVLFGDGAGAAVLKFCEEGGILADYLGANGSGGRCLTLQNLASPDWDNGQRSGQHGNKLWMKGQEVFKFAVKVMADSAKKVVEKAGLTTEDIDFIIPHQANIRIIEAAANRLKIGMDRIFLNVDKCGNISAASIPLALAQASEQGRIKRGDLVVLVGFGGGLTWGAMAVQF